MPTPEGPQPKNPLSEKYFTETTTRDRSIEFIDDKLKFFGKRAYKVSGLEEDSLPVHGFPEELSSGLTGWIRGKAKNGEKICILNLGGGESDLGKFFERESGVIIESLDLYPKKDDAHTLQHDLNETLPFKEGTASFVICSFVLPYLKDPLKTLNEAIRVSKPGGYILFNGARRIFLEREGVYFFSSNNPVEDPDLIFYNEERFSGGDWVLIRVNNPRYQFKFSLDKSKSITVADKGEEKMIIPVFGTQRFEARDIRDAAVFVYKSLDKN